MNIVEIISFLEDLKKNNNREWFNSNRERYLSAKNAFDEIILQLIKAVASFDDEIKFLEPKDCVFRIYRDVRFGKDKSPYKTNFGGFIVKNGKKSGNAGYYLHLDPDESFIGGGSHMPPPGILKNIRSDVYHYYTEFNEIITNPVFVKNFSTVAGEKLKKIPAGFPVDFPDPELLKYKSYTVYSPLGRRDLEKPDFIYGVINKFKAMKPFITFLNRAIEAF